MSTVSRPPPPSVRVDPRSLERWVLSARRAWPELAMDEPAFRQHLTACAGETDAGAQRTEARAADLFLAFACARGDVRALAQFDAKVLPLAMRAARRTVRPEQLDEVKQQVRERLFLPATGPARIATYRGEGPLVAWVGTIAVRAALDLAGMGRPGTDAASLADELQAPGDDPELAYVRAHYGAELQAAFQKVLASLPQKDRAVLRLHYLEGLTTDAIARIYDVHRLTISRWVVRIRQQLFEETRRGLAARLGLSAKEVESALRLIRSKVDASLRGMLQSQQTPPESSR